MARGEKANSTIKLTVPAEEVEFGKEISISGKIVLVHESSLPVEYEFPTGTVKIEYVRPDGERITHTVPISKDGTFSDTIKVEKEGTWKVTASWDGNKDMHGSRASATMKVAPPLNIMNIAMIAGVVIVVVVVLIILSRRHRAPRRPVPPPPPP